MPDSFPEAGQTSSFLFLARAKRPILSRTMITEHVWDYETDHLSNVIDVSIGHLCQKLCAQGEPGVIQAIRHAGYQLKEPEQ